MKCTLEIRDEVNIKFIGLDVHTRRKISDKLKFFLPQATHMPAYKLGRWDGCVRFCDIGGRSYLHLLDRILPTITDAGYDIEIDDKRHPWKFDFSEIGADLFEGKTWPKGHRFEGDPIVLRDYQIEIINKFITDPQCIQQIATGAGKTLITAALSYLCEPYGRTIVIVPNKDLVVQTEEDYINLGLDVGVYYGDRKDYDKTHTICTWQSLSILEKASKQYAMAMAELDDVAKAEIKLSGYCWCCEQPLPKHTNKCIVGNGNIHDFIKDVVCIMVDEVHKAKADVLRDMLGGLFANCPIRWGLTGTVPKDKHEEAACISCIGPVTGQLSSKELQDMGILADLDIDVFQMQDGEMGFKNYAQELKWLVTDERRIKHISTIIEGLAQNGNTLVLIDRIATGELLAELNDEWVFVSGATKQSKRKAEYDEIAETDNKVIVATYGVAAVGLNIPRIFNLVLLEPGKSFVRVIQSIGRGVRKANDKDYLHVVDLTSNLKYSKKHLTKRKQYYREQEFRHKVTKIKYK